MIDVEFVTITHDDISIEVAVAGRGPLVVFVHGWPELWYSWRYQIEHLSRRGFRAAALNVRGYGGSSNPFEIERYTLRELAGDVAAVVDALGDGPAVVIGHDWGAPIAWNTARLHPELVRAVMGMSVPYRPVGPTSSITLWEQVYAGRFFYQLYFQAPGVAEAELGADHARTLRVVSFGASGESPDLLLLDKRPDAMLLEGGIDRLPRHLTDDDLAVYVAGFERSGWHGPLNRYRAQGLDADDLGRLGGGELDQPAAFVGGELDPVRRFVPGVDAFGFAALSCNDFRGSTIVPGAGHWVQQEAPTETNAAIDAFLESL